MGNMVSPQPTTTHTGRLARREAPRSEVAPLFGETRHQPSVLASPDDL